VSDSDMRTQCSDFCNPNGVSMLMGTTTFGFDLNGANNICLPPNGVLKYDKAKLDECSTWASAFDAIETSTAAVVKQLTVFKAAKLLFSASVMSAVKDVQAYVTTKDFIQMMDKAVNKREAFLDAITMKMQLNSSDGKTKLDAEVEKLKAVMETFHTSLEGSLEQITQFLEGCNDLYVAKGPKDEYLLDICAQQNGACIDEEKSGHVSCCCAYNPVTMLGKKNGSIITGLPGSARRLAAASAADPMDMCAQAWTDAQPEVEAYFSAIEKLGSDQTKIITEYEQLMVDKYGTDYCSFFAGSGGGGSGSKDKDGGTASDAMTSGDVFLPTFLAIGMMMNSIK